MLDEYNFVCPEKLLRDDQAAQSVSCRSACVANNVGVSQVDPICGCGIDLDSSCQTGRSRRGSQLTRASMQVSTAYFFAGGRARWPLSKLSAKYLFEAMRFSWIGLLEDMMILLGRQDFGCKVEDGWAEGWQTERQALAHRPLGPS